MVSSRTVAVVGGFAALGLGAVILATRTKGTHGQTFTVNIVVSSGSSRVPNIPVEITGQTTETSITNSSGVAPFSNLPAGLYNLFINAIGYDLVNQPLNVVGNANVPVSLTPNTCNKTCPCGQVLDSISCTCNPQSVANLQIPAVIETPISGVSLWNCAGGTNPPCLCLPGVCFGNGNQQYPLFWNGWLNFFTQTCSKKLNSSGPWNIFKVLPQTIKAVDGLGNGVCGKVVNLSLDTTFTPFQSGPWIGQFGTFFSDSAGNVLGSTTSVTTGASGTATYYLVITMVVNEGLTQSQLVGLPFCNTGMGQPSYCNTPWSYNGIIHANLSYILVGTAISTSTVVNLPANLCLYTADNYY